MINTTQNPKFRSAPGFRSREQSAEARAGAEALFDMQAVGQSADVAKDASAARDAGPTVAPVTVGDVKIETRNRVDPMRAANLVLLERASGISKSQFAKVVEQDFTRFALMVDGVAPLPMALCGRIEESLDLPAGWLDSRHHESQIPEAAIAILKGERKSSRALEVEAEVERAAVSYPENATGKVAAVKETATRGGRGAKSNSNVVPLRPDVVSEQLEISVGGNESATPERASKSAPKKAAEQQAATKHIKQKGESMATTKSVGKLSVQAKNLLLLTAKKGSRGTLALMCGYSQGHFSLIVNGQRKILPDTCRNIEHVIGLPEKWMDARHTEEDIPEEAILAIGAGKGINAPLPESDVPRRGRRRSSDTAVEETTTSRAAAKKAAGKAPAAKKAGRKSTKPDRSATQGDLLEGVPGGDNTAVIERAPRTTQRTPAVTKTVATKAVATKPATKKAATRQAAPRANAVAAPAPAVVVAASHVESGDMFGSLQAPLKMILRNVIARAKSGGLGDSEWLVLMQMGGLNAG